MSAAQQWLDDLSGRLLAIRQAMAELEQLPSPPPVHSQADADAIMEWRRTLGLDGPGGDRLPAAADELARPVERAAGAAHGAILSALRGLETQLTTTAANANFGLISGAALRDVAAWHDDQLGDAFALALDSFGPDHPLRQLLTHHDCVSGGSGPVAVMFPAMYPSTYSLRVPRPQEWYLAAAVAEFTRRWRSKQIADAQAVAAQRDYMRGEQRRRAEAAEPEQVRLARRVAHLESQLATKGA